MKPSLYLLITTLFLVSCDQQEVATQQAEPSIESLVPTTTLAAPSSYDACITQTMQGVSSDVAARAIIESCRNQFPTESQEVAGAPAPVVVDASRLVTRNEITYEVNSDSPFTGVSLTYHDNEQVKKRATYKDGKQDGLHEEYRENGELFYSVSFDNENPEGVDRDTLEARGLGQFSKLYEKDSNNPYTGKYFLFTETETGFLSSMVLAAAVEGKPQGIGYFFSHPSGLYDETLYRGFNLIDGWWRLQEKSIYRDDGLAEIETYQDDGTIAFKESYTYTFRDDGLLDYREDFDGTGTSRGKVIYTYRDDGLRDYTEAYGSDGRPGERSIYTYRNDGSLEYIDTYKSDGTLRQRNGYKDGEYLGSCDEPGCTDFN